MENPEIQFADGMNFKNRHEKAPESVRGSVYFDVKKFKQFLDSNVDEKGYVNVKMMKSMTKGTIYFILDTWKPTKTPEQQQEAKEYNETKYKHPDPNVQLANEKAAQELFNQPLSEEEEFRLSQQPF